MRNRFALLALAIAPALALAPLACKRKPAEPVGPRVKVYVDDALVKEPALGTTPVALASLLSGDAATPDNWRRLQAQASGGRFLDVRRPAQTYEGAETRLYLQQGKAAIGLFRPVKPDLPPQIAAIARQPALSLVDVTEVRVRTKELPPPSAPPGPAGLLVRVSGEGAETVEPDALDGLPERKGERQQIRGWALADVIALRAPPEKAVSVTLTGEDGRSLSIEGALLADPAHQLLLKRNRKNEYVFHHWQRGKEKPVEELRGVTGIRVERTRG